MGHLKSGTSQLASSWGRRLGSRPADHPEDLVFQADRDLLYLSYICPQSGQKVSNWIGLSVKSAAKPWGLGSHQAGCKPRRVDKEFGRVCLVWVDGTMVESTGREYTRTLYRLDWCARCRCHLAQLQVPHVACPICRQEVFSLIQCQKSAVEANFLSEVKVQLHVYLFPLLRPLRGPQSLSPGGRTGFKCVLSSGGSCGRAREQSGPPSASHCCCLRRKLLIQGIAKSYDHNVGLQHKLASQQESQICDRDRAKAVNFTISEMNESLSRLSLASGHFLSSVSTIVAWPVEHQTSTWTKLVA